jgi:hypothetical protein
VTFKPAREGLKEVEMMTKRKGGHMSERDQAIAFLRGLKAGDEGSVIYQAVIDHVLAALDDACPHCGRCRDEAKKTEAERACDHFLSGAPMRDFEG